MIFDPQLKPGTVVGNAELFKLFRCSPTGSMRRSRKTGTLVIISDHVKSTSYDRWLNYTFHFTGMGGEGDQSLSFMQNKTLAQSSYNGVAVHLFEVHSEGEYSYIGNVALAGEPYREVQPDKYRKRRHVWVFPLRIVDGKEPPLTVERFRELSEMKAHEASKMPNDELAQLAARAPKRAGSITVTMNRYDRSHWVSEHAKRSAEGYCQLCYQPAPFNGADGRPFLETHHITWLAKGGEDSVENTVALCPNCHRRMHLLDLEQDKVKLRQITKR